MRFATYCAVVMLCCLGHCWPQEAMRLSFDEGLACGAVEPVVAEGAKPVTAEVGRGVQVGPGASLAYPAPAFVTEGFDIRLRVSHLKGIDEMHFEELTYLYHETEDGRNRILVHKRLGTDYILFAMSDGTGKAKGAQFAGNWFAMKSPPLDWTEGSWHELRLTASRRGQRAALHIDGKQVASAKGTQMPQATSDRFWLGNMKGRCQMLGVIGAVTIAPAGEVSE